MITPYISPRRCAEAIDWYVDVFGAVENGERFVGPDGRVGHASLRFGEDELMLSDAHLDYGAVAAPEGNVSATYALVLQVPDADATVAAAERAGAVVQRPVAEQFDGERRGTLVDPFGVRWMVTTVVREVGAEELAAAAREFSTAGAPPGPLAAEPTGGG